MVEDLGPRFEILGQPETFEHRTNFLFWINAEGSKRIHTPSVTAIRARRKQKDQLRAAHTIPLSHSGLQA
jgi:hypothetical protein